MKKIIYFLGILFLAIIVILNILFTANLDALEHITIQFNSIIYMMGLAILGIVIFGITKIIHKCLYQDADSEEKKKIRKRVFIAAIVIYAIFNIVWVIAVRPPIVGDQIHACNLAQTFYRNNLEEFLPNVTYAGISLGEYMQAYHQQISLSFVFSVFFRFIHFDGIGILRVLNIIGNIAIVMALYMISKQLSKKYEISKVRLLVLVLTFVSLTMLATFIYGDIPSLALCLFSVYFMMKYTETKKIKYPIFASIFTMVAYMMRMNSLIFIIATIIYLLLNLFNRITKKKWKENVLNFSVVIMYIVISIFPSFIVKSYYLNKYNMDQNKEYPTISYFLMAMEEAPRGNGWYHEARGEYALKNNEKVKTEYVEAIKERLKYFSENLGYTFEFYTKKLASMWTENTYSAVRNNTTQENDPLENTIEPLTFYQKALLLITCICSIIVLGQNRKNLSYELIFLLTIFVGGFAFHILWEAKSRYIVPYIVVLIPIASIMINHLGIKEKVVHIYERMKEMQKS